MNVRVMIVFYMPQKRMQEAPQPSERSRNYTMNEQNCVGGVGCSTATATAVELSVNVLRSNYTTTTLNITTQNIQGVPEHSLNRKTPQNIQVDSSAQS